MTVERQHATAQHMKPAAADHQQDHRQASRERSVGAHGFYQRAVSWGTAPDTLPCDSANQCRQNRPCEKPGCKTRGLIPMRTLVSRLTLGLLAMVSRAPETMAQMPDAIAAPGEAILMSVHAEGAQIYE